MVKTPVPKHPDPEEASASVRLKCVYAGHPGDPGPGDVIKVEATEAARLVSLGAAEIIGQDA